MNRFRARRPPASIPVAAAAIAGMSTLLAVGLGVLGILDRWVAAISRGLRLPLELPDAVWWLATAACAWLLAFALLKISGTWRRVVIWISTVVLIGAWAPVLILAAHRPEIFAPFVAAVWSGVCAMVYAGNYRLQTGPPEESPDETR